MHVLAHDIRTYRGRIVRTCGRWTGPLTSAAGVDIAWQLAAPDPTSSAGFQAGVFVAPCAGRRPRLAQGCITGRIAREDGSLEDPKSTGFIDHQTINFEWWLHPLCTPAPPSNA